MIRVKSLVILAVTAFMLFGCASGHEYTDYAQSIDSSNKAGQTALVAYFNKKSIDNQNIFKALGGSDDPTQSANNQMAIVLYTILSQQNDAEVLKYFTPKYASKPTTNADIGIALSNNFLPTLVKWGAGAWLGGQIVDGLQTTSTVLGAGASMVNQSAGNDISGGPSITSETSTSNIVNTATSRNSYGGDNNGTQEKQIDNSGSAAEEVVEEPEIEEPEVEVPEIEEIAVE